MYSKKDQLKQKKKPRKKKCKQCKDWFIPQRDMQSTCGFECAIAYGKKDEVKQKAITQKKREWKQSDKSKLKEEAQKWFNRFIRLRDKELPCISCDYDWTASATQRQAHASHYMSVSKSAKLRFNEYNVHKSCQICNTHLSGNLAEYRIRLIKKIGSAKVEELEKVANEAEPCKYTIEDLKKIIVIYKEKCKNMV